MTAAYEPFPAKRTTATHCACCGQFRPWCVCGGGAFTDAQGRYTTYHCSPADHGRQGYGFEEDDI